VNATAKYALVSCILAGGIVVAAAQSFEQRFEQIGKLISDEAATEAIKLALTKIDQATCESNKPCARASAEEFSRPPIKVEDGRAAMIYAVNSALAQWCGLDWKRSFLPMIAYGKHHEKMTDRKLQLMTLIHGDFMGRQLASYMKSGQCPANLKARLDTDLPRLNR
jgi:hypothetical protein